VRSLRPPHSSRPASGADGAGGDDSRSKIEAVQRARLIAATTELICERGATGLTVAAIVQRAAISRRTFYELFSNCEQCQLAALAHALDGAQRRALIAYQGVGGGWSRRVRAALEALLAFFDEHPQAAHLLVVESLGLGPKALRLRADVLRGLISVVEEGRREHRRGPEPAVLAGEALVGGALFVLHGRLAWEAEDARRPASVKAGERPRRPARRSAGAALAGRPEPPVGRLVELTGQLMSMIVMPYMGAAAARKELHLPSPQIGLPVRDAKRRAHEAPLGPPGMRFTHRTVVVLAAIAELSAHGSAPSNRQIATMASVRDQGQMSKLLARLRKLGLIDNAGGRERGVANAWRLTRAGESVVCSLRA
jgi:AcrR family transcriptional regulator